MYHQDGRKRKYEEGHSSRAVPTKIQKNHVEHCIDPNSFRDLSKCFGSEPNSTQHRRIQDPLSIFIWKFFQKHLQTSNTFIAKIELWSTLDRVLGNRFGCSTHVFGSTLNGFGTSDSDMDICMFQNGDRDKSDLVQILAEARRLLRYQCQNFSNDMELIAAKVPILKIYDRHKKIEIDLSCSNEDAVRNTNLLFCYSQLDWRVRPLVIILKSWAKNSGINEARFSTLSSYVLAMMIINYLQCGTNPPVLPSLQSLKPELFNSNSDIFQLPFMKNVPQYNSTNQQSLGELLIGFFRYYQRFDFASTCGSVRLGRVLTNTECYQYSKDRKDNPRQWDAYICMEEPFNRANTGRAVIKREQFDKILWAIDMATKYLERSEYDRFLYNCY